MRLTSSNNSYGEWVENFAALYESVVYDQGSIFYGVHNAGHRLLERPFPSFAYFDSVLEVGCGSGVHQGFVRHGYGQYHFSDAHEGILDVARNARQDPAGRHHFHVNDARSLNFPDDRFDRVISVYMLEHVPEPHTALLEWARVLKPGGVLSLIIPTEGGLAWNLGRHLSTRRIYRRKGIDYDYIIAREHINACYRLVALIRHYFPELQECWYPLHIPTPHLNLFYAAHARMPGA